MTGCKSLPAGNRCSAIELDIGEMKQEKRNETTLLPGEDTVPMCFYIDPKGALTKMAASTKNFIEFEKEEINRCGDGFS